MKSKALLTTALRSGAGNEVLLLGSTAEEADVVLHFGWGLGYSGTQLIERSKANARVSAFEPDADVFDLFRAEGVHRELLEDSRFHYVVGPSVSQFVDEWNLEGCQDTDRILWIGWPRAGRMCSELSNTVRTAFTAQLRDRAGNLLTHFTLQPSRVLWAVSVDQLNFPDFDRHF